LAQKFVLTTTKKIPKGENPFDLLDKVEKINGRIKIRMGEFG